MAVFGFLMKKNILIIDNFLYLDNKFFVNFSMILKECLEREGIIVNFSSTKPNRTARLIDILVSIFRYRKSYQAALICVFSGRAFLWAYLSSKLCYLLKKPYILYLHGGGLPLFIEKKRRSVTSIFKKSLYTIAPSDYLKERLQGKGIGAVKVIPNFIYLKNYNFKRRRKISPTLFWLRAYHHVYNPRMAVRVLYILKKDYPQASLTMAGADKGELTDVRSLARNLGVYNSAHFLESISKKEINTIGSEHNIFINTTHIDNMPVTILEAMAMGLAIVSTNVGGMSYLLEDGKEALLVADNDDIAMAEAIRRLLKDPELVRYLTTNSRAKVERFTWEGVRKLWYEALKLT